MVIYISVIGKMINVMDMVYIHIMMVLFIKEIGLMINKMDMV